MNRMSLRRACALGPALLAAAIAGCAQYAPVKLDPKTNQYGTIVELDKSAFREYVTDVDPRAYRFVALSAVTNSYPGRFEFFVRNALADLGMTRVLNRDELVQLVKMHPKLESLTSISDPLALRRISEVVGPMMILQIGSVGNGGAARFVTLRVTDASSGRVLLRIENRKMIWLDVDSEAHLPLLNALRQWFQASTRKSA